jgi:HPt (histidine-containing phosphotransfer) domain-containing protein
LNTPDSDRGAAKPLVDLEQLQSACDGDLGLMRELMDLYFGQADQIMAGLGKGIAAGDVREVDHLSHKLAGSSLACGMAALLPPLRQLELNAKAGHLQGAPDLFAQVGVQLEAVRRFMHDHLLRNPPQDGTTP